jgi:hypothetical protein
VKWQQADFGRASIAALGVGHQSALEVHTGPVE